MLNYKRMISFMSAILILMSTMTASAKGQTLAEQLNSDSDYGVSFQYSENKSFSDVRAEFAANGYTPADIAQPVTFAAKAFSSAVNAEILNYKGKTSAVKWTKNCDKISWDITVPATGIYSVRMQYIAADNGMSAIMRSLKIDGQFPYSEAQSLSFYRLFKDAGAPIVNSIGDEVAPDVEQYFEWQWQDFLDTDAAYDGALQFYLTAGTHSFEMEYISGDLYLYSIELYSPSELSDYSTVEQKYNENGYKLGSGSVHFEAEDSERVLFKNSSTLRAVSSSDPGCTPYKYGKSKINTFGGTLWQSANSAITYNFSVDTDGLYAISMRLLMNFRDGIPSYRSIAIDGQVPFKEFNAYKFTYSKKWRTEILGDGEKPYYIYLKAGEHTLTLTTKQGDVSSITAALQNDSDIMSQMLLKIKMIIGQNPDTNYDYELDKQIPDLMSSFDTIISDMETSMNDFEKLAGRKQSKYYQIKSFVSQLKEMRDNPFSIPSKVQSIEEIITTYGSWLSEMQAHPLTLDFIEILSDTNDKTVKSSNFLERTYGSLVNFVLSFTKDYNNVAAVSKENGNIKETISVWVSRGTKWCQIMKQLIDSDFTPNTGVAVNLNVLPAGQLNSGGANALLLSITSGRAPDVATGVSSSSIGEFAMRNSLVDVSEQPNFESIRSRFKSEHFVPLTYNGKVYALPETQNFLCMIYRKDIFSRLGLSLPNTWDELYNRVIPILNQNKMQFYVPLTVDSYNMFLYQLGGEYYHDDLKTTALDSSSAYRALVEYTNLYTLYGVPQTASFYNRFRSGEMPAGIVDYKAYMTVKAAAGDIRGKWGLALIPGHLDESGNINRSHSTISAECCMVISQTKHKNASLEFLDWWTSDETQAEYANRIESTLGSSARWVSANWSVFTSLPWEKDELTAIEKSFDGVRQAPVVLGGYYVSRHITNALNRVVVSGINSRDSIETAVDDINRELQRRRESAS